MSIRGFGDLGNKPEEEKKRNTNDYYAGGDKSGIAIQTPDDVNDILNQARNQSADPGQQPGEDEISIKITLWKNGFCVDDGEFRDYDEPQNKQFMTDIRANRVPQEIFQKTRGKPVAVNLDDKSGEDYRPPTPPSYVAFSGEGVKMSDTTSSAAEPINMSQDGPPFDESQPTCMIQVRFHNGQTKKITMNTESPVSLLHEFVMMAAPVDGSY